MMLTKLTLVFTIFAILNRNPLTYVFHEYSAILGGVGMILCMTCLAIDFSVLRKKNDRGNFKLNVFDLLLLFFLIYMLGRSLFTIEMDRSLVGLLLYLGFIPSYLIARAVKISAKEIYFVTLGSFIYLTIFGYLQWMFAIPFGEMQMATSPSFSRFYPMRITSTLGSSLHFGIIYTLLLVFLNSKLLFSNQITKKNILIISFLNFFALLLIIGTYSRAAILLYLLTNFILLFFLPKKIKRRLLSIVFAILILGIIILFQLFPVYFEISLNRFLSTFDVNEPSNVGRFNRYKKILSLLIENPSRIIFGVGPGYTGNIMRVAGIESIFQREFGEEGVATESYPAKILLELGIIGLILFYLIFFEVIKQAIYYFKKNRDWLFLSIPITLIGIFFHSLTLQSLEIPGVAFLFWFLIGLISHKRYAYYTK